MEHPILPSKRDRLREAVDCMERAPHLLDAAEAPAQIGAHLDLALHMLRDEPAMPWAVQIDPKNRG